MINDQYITNNDGNNISISNNYIHTYVVRDHNRHLRLYELLHGIQHN